ncbi:uncharacterized protein LOC129241882 [Anastrepha obliqua]|uniref:uncharacterized protein LOC129241882 n=1 Tax=Anastrepha obliqua TaxID=95512 RepID=UPI0024097C8B|nr:uncharacterized protein LOC129241882 [Anastrepha obliqua]
MIDEQHPIQIATLPLGLKCHTPIQQQHQHQQQQQTTSMMMSGSQRMLTTLAAALKATTSGATTSDNGAGNSNEATKPIPTLTTASMVAASVLAVGGGACRMEGAGASAMATTTAITGSVPSREVLCGSSGVACGEMNGNPTTPTASASATASTTFYTNVIGNCNSHKNNSNATNDNKCYNNVNNKVSNANAGQRHQQQQQHQQMELNAPVTGPGPGRPPSDCSPTPLVPSMFCSDRTTLVDFNLNVTGGCDGGNANCNNACTMAAIYTANNNSNNNCIDHNGNSNLTSCLNSNNGSNANTNNSMFLSMQSHMDNGASLQQKQQQQHLQLHFGTHMHTQFPTEGCSPCHTPPTASLRHATTTATKCDSLSAATALELPVALPLSLSLHLPLSSALTCRTASAPDAMQCAYCCQPICDRYIMRVVDTSFHEGCLKCATCALHLVHSCYARDGKLYCRIDYERQFIRNRCLGCGHRIASDELVMRTFDNVFHLKCFACVVCGGLLKKGEQYVVKQGQLFCRLDYEKEVEMLQGYDFYGDDLFTPKLDGRRGPKRPRTILNTQQRRAFKASFELSPKPCRKVRENLAKETGLSLRIVQVWFQNQRAKVKKIQKKAKQEHPKGASDSQDSQESDNSNLAKIKDEAHSDSESLLESPFIACVGSAAGGGGASSCADGVVKMRSIKDENENTSFNCMETNKENCNKTNEPFLSTVLGLSYSTFQQLMGPLTQSPMVNPIDRLYSMQNSYFRPEELGYSGCSKDLVES